jgi:hypothetical protein
MTTPSPLTPAQRKAAQRQRQREQGLVKLELWAPPDQHVAIRAFAEQLAAENPADSRCQVNDFQTQK